jgi:hypothetical protein
VALHIVHIHTIKQSLAVIYIKHTQHNTHSGAKLGLLPRGDGYLTTQQVSYTMNARVRKTDKIQDIAVNKNNKNKQTQHTVPVGMEYKNTNFNIMVHQKSMFFTHNYTTTRTQKTEHHSALVIVV